jgi:hypothetical protein
VVRYFWAAHQRFFRDLIVAFKVPCALRIAHQALNENKCVVIGLQSTGGAAAERESKRMEKSEGLELADLISAPHMTIERLVKKVFPLDAEGRRTERSMKVWEMDEDACEFLRKLKMDLTVDLTLEETIVTLPARSSPGK